MPRKTRTPAQLASCETLELRRLLAVTIDFEALPLGFISSGVYSQDGFVFANVPGDGGSPTDPLRVDDESQGFDSQVLTTFNWARRIAVTREDGTPFSVERFDYAAGRWDEPGDFVLTGRFADGSTDTRTVSFDSRAATTLELGWGSLVSLDLNFAGGENNAYGAVDNFVFNGEDDSGATTTGSLLDPDPVAGPLLINFDGRSWNETYAVLPRSDGSFFVVGSSGLEPPEPPGVTVPVNRQPPTQVRHHLTLHRADGTIDRTWGTNGRSDLPPELVELVDLSPFVSPRDRIQPMEDGYLMRHQGSGGLIRFDEDLQRDLSFGTDGVLAVGGDFAAIPGGGFTVLDGDMLRVFDDGGEEIASTNAHDQILPLLFSERIDVRRIGDIAADAFGNIYVGVTNITLGGDDQDLDEMDFAGTARFLPTLQLDESYGHRGISRQRVSDLDDEIHQSLFVSADGRALLGIDENDGARNVVYFDAAGDSGQWVRYGGDSDVWAASFLTGGRVAFVVHEVATHGGSAVVENSSSGRFFPFRVLLADAVGDLQSVANFDEFTIPRRMRSVFSDTDGTFVLGGFLEEVGFNGEFPNSIDHHAAVWRVEAAT